jgi:hypothetical protein
MGYKVKTFTSELKIFHTRHQLGDIDALVNKFIADNGIKSVVSVSDSCTTDDKGASIGLIRVLAYDDGA